MVYFLIYSTNYLMAEDSNVVRKLKEEGENVNIAIFEVATVVAGVNIAIFGVATVVAGANIAIF